jgi:hypothetical protein
MQIMGKLPDMESEHYQSHNISQSKHTDASLVPVAIQMRIDRQGMVVLRSVRKRYLRSIFIMRALSVPYGK